MIEAGVILACYLLGSVPFGLIAGYLVKGVDIRKYGSGNIGASNVMRTLGWPVGVPVFILDVAKGFVAVEVCKQLGFSEYVVVAGAFAAILGHTFSVFLKFKGGKGVATSLGMIIGFDPVIAGLAFVIWLVVVGITRYISVASVVATVSVPVMMVLWVTREVPAAYLAVTVVAAVAIIIKHISNFKRLANGTENRIGQRVKLEG